MGVPVKHKFLGVPPSRCHQWGGGANWWRGGKGERKHMAHITMADLFEEETIDLWGVVYEVVQSSQAVEEKFASARTDLVNFQKQMEAKAEELEARGEADVYDPALEKKGRELYAAAIDCVLRPVENGDGNKPPRAKTHLLALYRDKTIGTAQIDATFDTVMEAFGKRNRPTQTSPGKSES